MRKILSKFLLLFIVLMLVPNISACRKEGLITSASKGSQTEDEVNEFSIVSANAASNEKEGEKKETENYTESGIKPVSSQTSEISGEIAIDNLTDYDEIYKNLDLTGLPEEIVSLFFESKPFTASETGAVTNIYDYMPTSNLNLAPVFYRQYLIMDLDEDGINELCCKICDYTDYLEQYIIFHLISDKVYSYELSIREVDPLFADGTFMGSDGAPDCRVFKITSFLETGIEYEMISQGNDLSQYYIIDGANVTQDEFWTYAVDMTNNKERAKWNEIPRP